MRWLKRVVVAVIVVSSAAALGYLLLPKGPRDLMSYEETHQVRRAAVTAEQFMASTGTPWATEAALAILRDGGNAFDAAMAALLALNVTYPEAASFPSVAPTLIFDAQTGRVRSYNGLGTAPQKATIEFFTEQGYETVPEMGILAQLLPASPDALIAILTEYGTRSFSEIAVAAIRLADEGFPTHAMMTRHLDLSLIERFGYSLLMPYNAEIYLGGEWWRPLNQGDRFLQKDLARTLRAMAAAEQSVLDAGGSREEGLMAVRDYFYKGPIADAIVAMHEREDGLFTAEDLASYQGYWEEPVTGSWGDYVIHAHQTWSQGAVLPMALQILEGIDLQSMGHNSPVYVHTLLQAIELAMADREAWFGDQKFVDVPIEGLLSKRYAALRRELMSPDKAFVGMPPHGNPDAGVAAVASATDYPLVATLQRHSSDRDNFLTRKLDTSYLAVTDAQGNSVSLTPSDFPKSPMVPGTGLNLGIRMTQFRLDPEHPAALMPGKRPRLTPNASMVTRNGELYMTFGTPEGDQQPQALLQFFLNMAVFGMDVQQAIEAPRFRSQNFPDSFSPHTYRPRSVKLEHALYETVGPELTAMGYSIEPVEDLHHAMGAIGAIIRDSATGALVGGADPRQSNLAAGE